MALFAIIACTNFHITFRINCRTPHRTFHLLSAVHQNFKSQKRLSFPQAHYSQNPNLTMASGSAKGKRVMQNEEEMESEDLYQVKQTIKACNFVRNKIPPGDLWTAEDYASTPLFVNRIAQETYCRLDKAPVLSERGITGNQPFGTYIKKMRWQTLCGNHLTMGNKELTNEFFANLLSAEGGKVYVRGKYVNITPEALNQHFGIPEVGFQGKFTEIPENPIDLEEMGRILMTNKAALPLGCQFAPAQELNDQAWTWFIFVNASMMPQWTGTTATMAQLQVIYTIMRGGPVNAGAVIYNTLCSFASVLRNKPFTFFPTLVHGLCSIAGVNVDAIPSIVIPPAEKARPQLRRNQQ